MAVAVQVVDDVLRERASAVVRRTPSSAAVRPSRHCAWLRPSSPLFVADRRGVRPPPQRADSRTPARRGPARRRPHGSTAEQGIASRRQRDRLQGRRRLTLELRNHASRNLHRPATPESEDHRIGRDVVPGINERRGILRARHATRPRRLKAVTIGRGRFALGHTDQRRHGYYT